MGVVYNTGYNMKKKMILLPWRRCVILSVWTFYVNHITVNAVRQWNEYSSVVKQENNLSEKSGCECVYVINEEKDNIF